MEKKGQNHILEKKSLLVHDRGKIYFNSQTERKFYFILTIIMLLSGILIQVGVFH